MPKKTKRPQVWDPEGFADLLVENKVTSAQVALRLGRADIPITRQAVSTWRQPGSSGPKYRSPVVEVLEGLFEGLGIPPADTRKALLRDLLREGE